MDAAIQAAVQAELADWQPLLTPMTDPLQTVLDEARRQGWTARQGCGQGRGIHLCQRLGQAVNHLLRLMFAAAASEAGASV